jgi:hypothetical protein
LTVLVVVHAIRTRGFSGDTAHAFAAGTTTQGVALGIRAVGEPVIVVVHPVRAIFRRVFANSGGAGLAFVHFASVATRSAVGHVGPKVEIFVSLPVTVVVELVTRFHGGKHFPRAGGAELAVFATLASGFALPYGHRLRRPAVAFATQDAFVDGAIAVVVKTVTDLVFREAAIPLGLHADKPVPRAIRDGLTFEDHGGIRQGDDAT